MQDMVRSSKMDLNTRHVTSTAVYSPREVHSGSEDHRIESGSEYGGNYQNYIEYGSEGEVGVVSTEDYGKNQESREIRRSMVESSSRVGSRPVITNSGSR